MSWRYYTNRRLHGWMRPAGIPEQTVTAVTLTATPVLPAADVAQQPAAVTLTTTPSFPAARVDHDITTVTLTASPSLPAATLLAGSFPSIPSGAAGYGFSAETTNTTTHDVVVPTTINAGDLLLVFVGQDGAQDPDLSGAGFTQLRRLVGPSSLCLTEVWGKVATGSETNFTYPITNNEQSQNHCIRVIDWSGSLSGVEVSTGATGTSTTPDADALNPSGWGTEDTLWLTFFCQNDANAVGTPPTDYATIGSSAAGSAGSVNTHLAKRENAVASEDPGAFGATGASDAWAAVTVAVRPVVAAQSITAVTLSATPSLPSATLRTELAAVVLTAAPSLPAATITADASLTAVTLTATPSLPAASLSTSLTAVALSAAPSLPQAALAHSLTAQTLSATPSLPAARVDHSLAAVVLTVTPALPAAQLDHSLTAVVLSATPSLPVAEVQGDYPTPTIRGAEDFQGLDTASAVIDMTSVCTGAVLLLMAVSKVGTGDLGSITSITGGGVTGWTLLARGNPAGPRSDFAVQLEGSFDGTDITVTFGTNIEEIFARVYDWANARTTDPFPRVEYSGSVTNAASHTVKHQKLLYAGNSVISTMMTGGGSDSVANDEGTLLASIAPSPGLSAVGHAWKGAGFTNQDVVWSWTSSWSNLGMVVEVAHPNSPTGWPGTRPTLLVEGNVTSGTTADTVSVTPAANSVLVVEIFTERTASSAALSSVQHDPTGTPVSFSALQRVSIDADHQLHVWSGRFGASPAAAVIRMTAAAAQSEWIWRVWQFTDTAGTTNTDWAGTPVTGATTGTSLAIDSGTPGTNSAVIGFWGQDARAENFTAEDTYVGLKSYYDSGVDGIQIGAIYTTWLANNGDDTAGVTIGSSADLAGVVVEVLEPTTSIVAATLSATPSFPQASTSTDLTAATLTASPSLPAASLATSITAAVLTATPTLPAASVITASQIAAVTLEATPTLPQASVQVASIAAQTLTTTPSLPQASLATSLSAQALSATPTQPAATLRTDVGAVVLTVTPTQPAATLRSDITAVTLSATPTLPAATVTADAQLTAQTLTATPVLPAASLTRTLGAETLSATPTFPTASIGSSLTAGTLVLSPVLPAAHLAQDAEVQALTLLLGPTLPAALVVQGALGEAPGRGPTSVSGRSGTGVRGRTSTSTRGDLTTTGVR